MNSLRRRFTTWLLAATAILAVAAGASLYLYVRAAMFNAALSFTQIDLE